MSYNPRHGGGEGGHISFLEQSDLVSQTILQIILYLIMGSARNVENFSYSVQSTIYHIPNVYFTTNILGAANKSIFSPTTSFGRFGGGEGFHSRRFQIETLYRKRGLIKKSQPVKTERCLC